MPIPKDALQLDAQQSQENIFLRKSKTLTSEQNNEQSPDAIIQNILGSIEIMTLKIQSLENEGILDETFRLIGNNGLEDHQVRVSKSLIDLKKDVKQSIEVALGHKSESNVSEFQVNLQIPTQYEDLLVVPSYKTNRMRSQSPNQLHNLRQPKSQIKSINIDSNPNSSKHTSYKVTPQYIKEKLIQKINERSQSPKKSHESPNNKTFKRNDQFNASQKIKPYTQSQKISNDKAKKNKQPGFNNNDDHIKEVAKFLDQDAHEFLKNTSKTQLSQISDQAKSEEIVQRIVHSNSAKNGELISIPPHLMKEIEEQGLDSLSILQSVLIQFRHLFKNEYRSKSRTLEKSPRVVSMV